MRDVIEYFPLTGALSPYLAGVSTRPPSAATAIACAGAASGSSEPPPPPSPLALPLSETGAQQLQHYYASGLEWQREARALVLGYLSAQGFAESVRALHTLSEGALAPRLEGIARRKSALSLSLCLCVLHLLYTCVLVHWLFGVHELPEYSTV